ncbi:hypothetical protein LINPERHAP2_LOCUS21696 [Linum perenne]
MEFLRRCVVFRFSGDEEVDWTEFQTWSQRNWGIARCSVIRPVGDDLWLLECASEKEVLRIVALGRWRFKGLVIQLDRWIKMAGHSNVLWESDVAWVVVRGIPLHLRSSELIRSLGEACGGFLSATEGTDMSSVWIKVKIRGPVPEVIPLYEGMEVFPVTVGFEAGVPVPAQEVRVSTVMGRKVE